MDNPLTMLANAIRKRLAAQNLEEKAAAGKEGAQAVAEQLPEGIIPHRGLNEAQRRRAMMEKQMEDANR